MISCDELEFGLRDDRIVLINEILPEENGNKCGCICPHCRQDLQARTKGKKRRPHFAHIRNACDTKAARETALHMLAKQILSEKKEMLFPGIEFFIEELDIPNLVGVGIAKEVPQSVWFPKPKIVKFDEIVLEKAIDDIIPDCVVYAQGKPCIVEFAVTHIIDDAKYKKLERLGIPAVEVDLKACYKKECSREEIEKAVLYEEDNRYWASYPREEEAKEKATQYYIKWFDAFRAHFPGRAWEFDQRVRKTREAYLREIRSLRERQDGKKTESNQHEEEESSSVPADDSVSALVQERIDTSEAEKAVESKKEYDPIMDFKPSLLDHNFEIPEEIYDSYGNRFVKCTECGEIKLSLEMSYYQFGKGICKLCSRKLK